MKQLQFGVEMADLKRAIQFVKNGQGASKTDLTVQLLKITVINPNKLRLFTCSKEVVTKTELKVSDLTGEIRTCSVMCSKIESLVSQVESETLTFTIDEENMEVKTGFLTVNFELYDGAAVRAVEDGIEEVNEMEGAVVPKWVLEEAFVCSKSCQTAVSMRPDIAHTEVRGQRVMASDGRKIMMYMCGEIPEAMGLKVSSSALNQVVGAVKAIEDENLEVVEGSSYFFLKVGTKNVLGVRKIDRSFPAVETQIGSVDKPEEELSIDKHMLEAMLRGVALGLPSDEVGVSLEVSGVDKDSTIEVAATNSLGRRSFERASCGRKGGNKSVQVPVSFKHLLDTVSVFKGDSVVDILVLTDRSILIVRDKTPNREVLTVIPFRTAKLVEEEKKEKAERMCSSKKAKEGEKDVEMAEEESVEEEAVEVE